MAEFFRSSDITIWGAKYLEHINKITLTVDNIPQKSLSSDLISSSVVVDFRHGAKGGPEFVHGWSGWVGFSRKRAFYMEWHTTWNYQNKKKVKHCLARRGDLFESPAVRWSTSRQQWSSVAKQEAFTPWHNAALHCWSSGGNLVLPPRYTLLRLHATEWTSAINHSMLLIHRDFLSPFTSHAFTTYHYMIHSGITPQMCCRFWAGLVNKDHADSLARRQKDHHWPFGIKSNDCYTPIQNWDTGGLQRKFFGGGIGLDNKGEIRLMVMIVRKGRYAPGFLPSLEVSWPFSWLYLSALGGSGGWVSLPSRPSMLLLDYREGEKAG